MGVNSNEPFLPKTGERTQHFKSGEDGIKELAELLKVLVAEVRQIRNDQSSNLHSEL